MFGLTFEKLFLVAIVAAFIVGPARLPAYAQWLAETVRALRTLIEGSRAATLQQMGLAPDTSFDVRQYDPRQIVRDALRETKPREGGVADDDGPDVADPDLAEQARRVRPGQRYLVTGSAAHPVRIRIDALPHDDPRRIAALPDDVRPTPRTDVAECAIPRPDQGSPDRADPASAHPER